MLKSGPRREVYIILILWFKDSTIIMCNMSSVLKRLVLVCVSIVIFFS